MPANIHVFLFTEGFLFNPSFIFFLCFRSQRSCDVLRSQVYRDFVCVETQRGRAPGGRHQTNSTEKRER